MARIQYSSIVSDIRGSIAGHTMQRGPFGATIRTKPKQLIRGSLLQNASHLYMSRCHQAWAAMTNVQRAQWESFIDYSLPMIRKDKKILLSGHALFLKYNSMRLHSGLDILTELSYNIVESNVAIDSLYYDGFFLTLVFTEALSEDSIWVSLKISGPLKNTTSNARSFLRSMPLTDGSSSFWNITDACRMAFGFTPKTGDRIYTSTQVFSATSPTFGSAVERFFIIGA